MAIHQSIRELIGNTPLVQLNRYAAKRGLGANILAKIEYFNPAGSVKDRVGFAMLDAAEKAGKLNSGTDQWQHRHRLSRSCCRERPAHHPDDAGNHERRAPQPA